MSAPKANRAAQAQPPRAWVILALEWLRLSPEGALVSWQAIIACQRPEVRAMRHSLMLMSQVQPGNEKLIHSTIWRKVHPRAVIDALEDAVTTGLLTRADASHLQEAVLTLTTKQTQWK